jgi:hypothetical protein
VVLTENDAATNASVRQELGFKEAKRLPTRPDSPDKHSPDSQVHGYPPDYIPSISVFYPTNTKPFRNSILHRISAA